MNGLHLQEFVCPVCGILHNGFTTLKLEPGNNWALCETHYSVFIAGYTAVIEVKETQDINVKLSTIKRTGNITYIKSMAIKEIFNERNTKPYTFVTPEVYKRITTLETPKILH